MTQSKHHPNDDYQKRKKPPDRKELSQTQEVRSSQPVTKVTYVGGIPVEEILPFAYPVQKESEDAFVKTTHHLSTTEPMTSKPRRDEAQLQSIGPASPFNSPERSFKKGQLVNVRLEGEVYLGTFQKQMDGKASIKMDFAKMDGLGKRQTVPINDTWHYN